MAPTQTSLIDHLPLLRRDDTNSTTTTAVPTCVTECMAEGNSTGCAGVTDYTCVCASSVYIDSVAVCWASSCNATEAAVGEAYATQACAYYGVNINSTTTTNTTSSSGSTATAADTAPVVYSGAFKNIQAALSSVCSALIVLAIVLGVMPCRARYKREQAVSQNRTWTGVGSHSYANSKDPKSSRFFTRTGNSSAFTNSRNQTATFASDNYGMTSSSFGGSTTLNTPFGDGRGGGGDRESFGFGSNRFSDGVGAGGRFTNRMTIGELNPANESEEWEMEVKHTTSATGSSSGGANASNTEDVKVTTVGGGGKDEADEMKDLESPRSATTFNSRAEYDVDGSTVHLNSLGKGDGPKAI